MADLSTLFAPDRVAVVGATDREGSVGLAVMRNLDATFEGDVVPVNPDRDRVLGRECVDRIGDVADVDLAVVVVPAAVVLSVVCEAAEAGILTSADTVGDRFLGLLFNVVSDLRRSEIDSLVTPYLDDRGLDTVGSLPRDVRLRGTTVDVVVERLDATTLTSGVDLDGRVERFTIGSMGSISAFSEFRRTAAAAVVVRGDRADVQRMALEAAGIRCLIVTGGRLETVLSERAGTAEQIDRMQSMLTEHVDVDALLDP